VEGSVGGYWGARPWLVLAARAGARANFGKYPWFETAFIGGSDPRLPQRALRRRAIFAGPLTPAEALGSVEALVRLPHVRLMAEETGFVDVYREVTGALPVRGKLVPDAHLVPLLRQHGVRTLYTRNGDFKKFPFAEGRDPFAA
jgi:hypothetical protein